MGILDRDSVKRVRQSLVDAGVGDKVIELTESARTAAQAAEALGVDQGAIVKSLVFTVGSRYVMALVAGDHRCREDQLPRIFNLEGEVVRPSADLVRAVTGFSIGGVAPVGLVSTLPVAIDVSLKRFDKIYPAAGHPNAMFDTTIAELKGLTGGLMSYALASPANLA